jgi:hypothetical protein
MPTSAVTELFEAQRQAMSCSPWSLGSLSFRYSLSSGAEGEFGGAAHAAGDDALADDVHEVGDVGRRDELADARLENLVDVGNALDERSGAGGDAAEGADGRADGRILA